MAGSYSTDLRSRVLAATDAGESPAAAAKRFAVGRSTAYRWVAAARDEGRREAKRMGGGPAPRITGAVEAALLGMLGHGPPSRGGRARPSPRPSGRGIARA